MTRAPDSRYVLRLCVFSVAGLAAGASLVACGGGGVSSQACTDYFEKVEACAEKAGDIKADALRKGAAISKENFEKNLNPLAVTKSCEMMMEALERDPDCKGE